MNNAAHQKFGVAQQSSKVKSHVPALHTVSSFPCHSYTVHPFSNLAERGKASQSHPFPSVTCRFMGSQADKDPAGSKVFH